MNVTPLMGLPYPSPTDDACDFDEQWCQFTEAVDAVFDRFEAGLARTVPAVPAAMLHVKAPAVTSPITLLNNNPIPFTDVVIDTAGLTDMDADPFGITVPITARWSIALFVNQLSSGSVDSQSQVSALFGVNSVVHTILDRGGTIFYYNGLNTPVVDITAGTRVTLSSFVSPVATRQGIEAWLAVVWHSDTERPS